MCRTFFILCLVFLIEINAKRRRCAIDDTLLSEKVLRSPIVVYGTSKSKTIAVGTTTELLFNITFNVECIFKGQNIERSIYITEAGIKENYTSCQSLDPGYTYVVFLERWGTNTNSYRPFDFHDFLVDEDTYEILEKTCHLARISPMNSIFDECPNVSMPEYCPHDNIDVSKTSEYDPNDMKTYPKSANVDNGNEMGSRPRGATPENGFQIKQGELYSKANAFPSIITSISMILITNIMIFIVIL